MIDREQARQLLKTLRVQQDFVALGPTGYSGEMSDAAKIFLTLSQSSPAVLERIRPELEKIALSSLETPAARIYSAELLKLCDPPSARDALESMLGNGQPCSLAPGGCCVIGESLDEVAAHLLGREPSPTIREKKDVQRTIEGLGCAPLYVDPDKTSSNSFARDFALLLEREHLEPWLEHIRALAATQPPASIYGAVLFCRVDPTDSRRLLDTLTRSRARVLVPGRRLGLFDRHEAVAKIAKRWLDQLR